ncbi:hypothetical protein Bca4012_052067 [Brassica carinata]
MNGGETRRPVENGLVLWFSETARGEASSLQSSQPEEWNSQQTRGGALHLGAGGGVYALPVSETLPVFLA